MTDEPTRLMLSLDARKRISLGRLAIAEHYQATVYEDGTIHLVPAAVVSLEELEVLRNPELVARLEEGIRQAAEGDTVNMTERVRRLAGEP